MKGAILKSIGALLAGIATGAILSVATDAILQKTGMMKTDPFDANPSWVIVGIIIYRTVYNIAGAYLTAKLAPGNPMKHVMLLGILGLAVGILGTIVMWHLPPHWYPITLDMLALPSAWLGGKLAIRKTQVMH